MASTPKAPDASQTAAAQQQADIGAASASAVVNNPNQYTPWGSRTYSLAGWDTVPDATGKMIKVPRYSETTTLSKDQQKLLGLQTQSQYNLGQTAVQQSAKMRDYLGKSVDTRGLTGWQTGPQAGKLQTQIGSAGDIRQDSAPTDRAAIERAMMSRYNTDSAKQNAAQEAQLAARGMSPGSQGWGDVQEQQTRARTDAMNQAYLASGAESRAAMQAYNEAQNQRYAQMANNAQFYNQATGQQYQMGSDWADRQNQLRQGQLSERIALRNQPINEITALMGGSQVTSPQFAPFSRQGVNPAPIGQYTYQSYGQQAQNAADINAGLFGLGSAAITGGFGPGGFFR